MFRILSTINNPAFIKVRSIGPILYSGLNNDIVKSLYSSGSGLSSFKSILYKRAITYRYFSSSKEVSRKSFPWYNVSPVVLIFLGIGLTLYQRYQKEETGKSLGKAWEKLGKNR